MDMIRIFNYKTNEVMDITFETPTDAENLEMILDFLNADYTHFYNGEE